MENKFISAVTKLIENKSAKKLIAQELESHILDKADYYVELGYSHEEAVDRATEDMGNPEDTAVPLNSLHKARWHDNKWCRFAFAILVLVFGVTCTLFHKFCYGSYYYQIPHFISVDFLSILIFAVHIACLHYARRKKCNAVVIATGISLILELIITEFNTMFQPMLYSVLTIAAEGIYGYTDSVFAYSYVPYDLKQILWYSSIALFVILMIWIVILFAGIYRQERAQSTKKLWKPIKIAEFIISILLAVNFVIMSGATISAFCDIDNKIAANQSQRNKQIDFVLNADMNLSSEEQLAAMIKAGFEAYIDPANSNNGFTSYCYINDNNALILTNNDNDKYSISYVLTTFDSDFAILNRNCYLTDEEIAQVELSMTLDDFLNLGWYTKATLINNYQNSDNPGIDFVFIRENQDESQTISLYFEKFESEYILTDQGTAAEG